MGKYKWLEENQKENKRYSLRLFGVIVFTTIAGISFRVVYNQIPKPATNIKTEISIQNEEELNTPTPATGSGSMLEDDEVLTDTGSDMEQIDTGTGSRMDDDLDTGSGSDMNELDEEPLKCGQVDSNKNGVVDLGDMKDFERVYQKECKIEVFKIVDTCGQKDFNNDNFIDMNDFVNIINKLKLVSCE